MILTLRCIFVWIQGSNTLTEQPQGFSLWICNGSGIVGFFSVWGFFLGFTVLSIFLAICSILNLEAAISTVFAAFWTSNLSLSIVFALFSLNLQHFGAGSCHFSGFFFTCLFHSFHWFFNSFHWFWRGVHWSFEVLIDFRKYTMCKL